MNEQKYILTDNQINLSIWNAIFSKLNPHRLNQELIQDKDIDLIKLIDSLHLREYPPSDDIDNKELYKQINSIDINIYNKYLQSIGGEYRGEFKEIENKGILTASAEPLLNISFQTLLKNMFMNGIDLIINSKDEDNFYYSTYYNDGGEKQYKYKLKENNTVDIYNGDDQINLVSQMINYSLPNIVKCVIIDGIYYNTNVIEDI
jgi:hypothetical protein